MSKIERVRLVESSVNYHIQRAHCENQAVAVDKSGAISLAGAEAGNMKQMIIAITDGMGRRPRDL